MERKNVNRGFRKLRVWQDAIDLYVLTTKLLFNKTPFELKKIFANSLDAAHSINRNIAEGYSRRSLREYLNGLNYALGSSGEFHSCCSSLNKAGQLSDEDYNKIDELHFKVENELIQLIKSLQKKLKSNDWNENFI